MANLKVQNASARNIATLGQNGMRVVVGGETATVEDNDTIVIVAFIEDSVITCETRRGDNIVVGATFLAGSYLYLPIATLVIVSGTVMAYADADAENITVA